MPCVLVKNPPIGERARRREFTHPLAEDYCDIVGQDFSIQASEASVETAPMLVGEVRSYTATARHIQEIEMWITKRPGDI